MIKRGGSKSYSVEPIYDPKKESPTKTEDIDKDTTISDSAEDAKEELDYSKLMESSKARKRRYFSLAVVCFTAFILALSNSIVMTSAKPYLDLLSSTFFLMDPEAGTQFLGLFIASQPLAQMFFSPLMGFMGNRLGSIRIPAIVSTLIMATGFAFYASVSAFAEPRRWYLFAARFVIGAAGGTTTLCYSYIASATTVKERTTALSILQMSKASAFIFGPLIQAAFVSLGDDNDQPIGDSGLYWNMYTAPAWLSVLFSMINIVALMPWIFTEYYIAKEEGEFLAARGLAKKKAEDDPELSKKVKPDKLALVSLIFISGATQFHFNVIDSLATLLVMEQLGLPSTRAVVLVSIMFSIVGVYAMVIFGAVAPLSRRIGERLVLILGVVCAACGIVCLYPYGGPISPLKYINDTEIDVNAIFSWKKLVSDEVPYQLDEFPSCYNASTALTNGAGCPAELQSWCCDIPAVHSEQMIVGFLLIFTGGPFAVMMCNVIFSKILGPYPQGTWTGFYGSGTAMARILSPLCNTSLYAAYGLLATCGFMTTMGAIILIVIAIFYRRLIPYQHAGS